MRRIYESSAIQRDDDDSFVPNERDVDVEPQAMRSIDGDLLSRHLIPYWLRYRAIAVDVSTQREEYSQGDPVTFAITLRNRFPFPVTIPTASRIAWTWSIDGLNEASEVATNHAPEQKHGFRFGRGERKRFTRTWEQSFRVGPRDWERAEPGEYTIRAGLNVEDATDSVADETVVTITE
ncbi:hypothetical protein [Salinarchaeum laminariae]|uniref:hypothetical protein n=1 Tax=Salinarchaeum laminariae TaxID=869888 RepID=UPI0020C1647C|nr:hypothetical protein [Salinarchaeum laminariae]